MTTLVKVPRQLLLTALDDLEREHPFAGERLGFFSFRQSLHDRTPILLCYDYHPIPDEHYVRDSTCEAGSVAMQSAQQWAVPIANSRASLGFTHMAGTAIRWAVRKTSSTDLKSRKAY